MAKELKPDARSMPKGNAQRERNPAAFRYARNPFASNLVTQKASQDRAVSWLPWDSDTGTLTPMRAPKAPQTAGFTGYGSGPAAGTGASDWQAMARAAGISVATVYARNDAAPMPEATGTRVPVRDELWQAWLVWWQANEAPSHAHYSAPERASIRDAFIAAMVDAGRRPPKPKGNGDATAPEVVHKTLRNAPIQRARYLREQWETRETAVREAPTARLRELQSVLAEAQRVLSEVRESGTYTVRAKQVLYNANPQTPNVPASILETVSLRELSLAEAEAREAHAAGAVEAETSRLARRVLMAPKRVAMMEPAVLETAQRGLLQSAVASMREPEWFVVGSLAGTPRIVEAPEAPALRELVEKRTEQLASAAPHCETCGSRQCRALRDGKRACPYHRAPPAAKRAAWARSIATQPASEPAAAPSAPVRGRIVG